MLRSHKLYLWMLVFVCACATQAPQDLTPLQDAYSVRDSIIIAKKGLNDARSLNKITKPAYETAWKTADDADKIVKAQLDSAHNGMVSKSALADAKTKLAQAKVEGGIK